MWSDRTMLLVHASPLRGSPTTLVGNGWALHVVLTEHMLQKGEQVLPDTKAFNGLEQYMSALEQDAVQVRVALDSM